LVIDAGGQASDWLLTLVHRGCGNFNKTASMTNQKPDLILAISVRIKVRSPISL